jgi:hypothetical protein
VRLDEGCLFACLSFLRAVGIGRTSSPNFGGPVTFQAHRDDYTEVAMSEDLIPEELEAVELDSEELTDEELDSEEVSEELSDESAELEGEEFEEITSEEVDRVVGQLETIIESVSSENVKSHLEEALNSIYFLVYDEEDLEDENDELLADAA